MLKTYIFKVELQEEEDGRWSVWIPVLSGCTSWGNSKEEAMRNIQEAVHAYVEDMIDAGEPLPAEAEMKKVQWVDSSVAVAV